MRTDGPKDGRAASAFQHSLQDLALSSAGAGRMAAIPTTMPQPQGGQGQILERIEAHGSQLLGLGEAPMYLC